MLRQCFFGAQKLAVPEMTKDPIKVKISDAEIDDVPWMKTDAFMDILRHLRTEGDLLYSTLFEEEFSYIQGSHHISVSPQNDLHMVCLALIFKLPVFIEDLIINDRPTFLLKNILYYAYSGMTMSDIKDKISTKKDFSQLNSEELLYIERRLDPNNISYKTHSEKFKPLSKEGSASMLLEMLNKVRSI